MHAESLHHRFANVVFNSPDLAPQSAGRSS
jgi:hypothetical protein